MGSVRASKSFCNDIKPHQSFFFKTPQSLGDNSKGGLFLCFSLFTGRLVDLLRRFTTSLCSTIVLTAAKEGEGNRRKKEKEPYIRSLIKTYP